MPQATNPKQSLSIDINRSERKYHWLQLLQFPDEEHHHRKLAQTSEIMCSFLPTLEDVHQALSLRK
jgi:hypothetical protein